ncbi:light-regulated protein, chloroplastic-like [Hibiscus syriacus]|nr:light-regulated protein, chloroplastic-like [Hibiscus syriacus]
MQAALSLTLSSPLPIVTTTKTSSPPCKPTLQLQTPRRFVIKATPVRQDNSTVDYSSTASVFPAEACETVGGEACDVEMFPEVKLKKEAQSNKEKSGPEQIEREYLEYNSPKTVFIGEACDDLGGEFCEPEYQKGVQ